MKHRATLALAVALGLGACGDGGSQKLGNETVPAPPREQPPESPDPSLPEEVNFTDVTVHDPSVIRTNDGTYYIFGSHLAAAKSTDLMNWTMVADGVNDDNPLFDTYAEEAAEGIAWVGGHVGSWAADVIQLEDGKYYFYYDHCALPETGACVSRSYMGVAVSDNIEGPYSNLGLFLRSGHVGAENPGIDGNDYDGNIHPNAIDPDVFFDADGKLWMVYGSYSGGIWVMEMDATTGFPLPDQGYGTKIMGGYYSAIEGPYMFYSPESEYYYLITSFGGYEQNDGYNMRVARSTSPTGPFLDASGTDMIGAAGNWNSIEPYGVKMMGGHMFVNNVGEAGTDHGYMAPGHNSAYYDEETGKHFLIFHTRYPHLGEGHSVRVHEMFINEDGWLVTAPHRYVPLVGENIVDGIDLRGTYQFINHEHDINREAKVSSYLTLEPWGVISGDYAGSYRFDDDNNITLDIDGLGSFSGKLSWQYNDNSERLTPTFTALSSDGVTIWGSQLDNPSDEETVGRIVAELAAGMPSSSQSNIELPTTGALGATIEWQTDKPEYINTSGIVSRPNAGEADAQVTLTATVTLNGVTTTEQYVVIVPARKPYNRVAQYSFEGNLDDQLGYNATATETGTTPDSTDGAVLYAAGQSQQAVWLDGTSGVRLPDGLINNYEYTVSMWVNPTVITGFTPAFFGAQANDNWLSLLPQSWDGNTMLWSGSQRWYDASTGLRIPENAWSHLAFSVKQGVVKVYVDGEERFSGGNFQDLFSGGAGVFTLGVNYWDLPFNGLIDELKIYEGALSAAEIQNLDIVPLPAADLVVSAAELLDIGDTSSLREDIYLPTTGAYAAAVSWESSNPAVISTLGEVTRPAAGEPDATVTLTATITLDGETATKQFTAVVRSNGLPTPLAWYSFDGDDLSDAQGYFAAGTPTAGLIGSEGGNIQYADRAEGRALVLDGASGVELPNNLITDNTYSFALWLNPTELNQFTPAFFGYANSDSWVSVVPMGTDAVSNNTMVWSGTSWYDAGAGQQIPTGSWSHLVVTLNGDALTIYINGEEAFSGTGFPDVFGAAAATGFAIGVNFWDTPFNGQVDELMIFDEVISASDAAQFYLQQQ
ncbi:family 43 glycosylhydrolase [Neiella sp. HB171785]|uniref:Family 43 glycosylhydrolase n=1 Tax=Neiella litorisoli TaxID=2771431 RepID=A0A8J6QI62_9GAMM|nr:LamG-like jellyroll fold domain-containing protein [Neiella litorisoli]MBD1389033.1 family 43 glycosylhydrolase [Neiella litorisoli]